MFPRWLWFLFLWGCSAFPVACPAGDWQLVQHENGIRIYTQQKINSDLKAQRGEMILHSSPAALVALLLDTDACSKWVDHCHSNTLLRPPGELPAQVYTVINAPWPLKPRDVAYQATFVNKANSGVVEILLAQSDDLVKPNPQFVRMAELTGRWRLEPLSNARVRVNYEFYADPGGVIPAWVVNIFAVRAAFRTLNNMRSIVQLPRYRYAHPDMAYRFSK